MFSFLYAIVFLVFSGLIELLKAKSAEVRTVAAPAWVIHLELAFTLSFTSQTFRTDSTGSGSIAKLDRKNLLLVWLGEGYLGVGGHGLHHVSGVHLRANVCPSSGTRIHVIKVSLYWPHRLVWELINTIALLASQTSLGS